MPRIDPLPREAAPEFDSIFQGMIDSIGYIPNSFLTMAREPGILSAVGTMCDEFWYPDTVSEPVRRLVTYAYSMFAGSHYSAAHCACGAEEEGLHRDKILDVLEYETSDAYSDAERALIRFCHHAANMPAEVTDDDMARLKAHYSEREVIFIIGLISFIAFLNKWNELVKTRLEDVPYEWSVKNLAPIGWHLER